VKFNLSQLTKGAKALIIKNTPEILTGIGIVGMITTAVMAVRATPKALTLIAEKEYDENTGDVVPLTKIEKVKTAWICYIPAGITCCLSAACLIGASSVNARRNAALATAYAITESALKEYQEKVVETIGEKKEQSIRDSIAKDRIDRHPVVDREVYILPKGSTLCYDVLADKYFESDINLIRKAENTLNKQLRNEDYVCVNDFYYEIGLPNTKKGDLLGWNSSDGDIEFRFSSQLTEDERPCLVIDYYVAPQYDYMKR
jgi:hypothetical protein